MKKRIIFLFMLFFFALLISPSKAETLVSDFNVSYDSELINAFEDRDYAEKLMMETNFIGLEIIDDKVWAKVRIVLKDNSGIEIIGNKSERASLVNKRLEWFEPITEEIIKDLPDSGFKEIEIRSEGFSALISEEGFQVLSNDERIKEIVWSRYRPELLLEESAPLIGAVDAWYSLGYNGTGIKVCIIDTGIDTDHPYLEDRIASEKCFNSDQGCPDETEEDDSAEDDHGHGTNVAGIIASQDIFEKGIAHASDLYIVRVTDENGEYSSDPLVDIGNAIDWCRTQSADIISMSFGSGPYISGSCPAGDIDVEINNAYNAGITLVSASGNDGEINKIRYPACNNQVIAVGGTYDTGSGAIEINWCEATGGVWVGTTCVGSTYQCEDNPSVDELACWSNRNSNLDLLAPGFLITTTALGGGFTDDYFGTSLSTSMISGAVALLLDKNQSLEPNEIKAILQNTGVSVYDSESDTTFKRVDVEVALNSICACSGWVAQSCGGGGQCESDEMYYTQSCNPSGAQCQESKCEYSPSCDAGGEPSGISGCQYEDPNDDFCSSGYEAIDSDCYWDGSQWECELECYQEGYCGSYGGWQIEDGTHSVDASDDGVWFSSPTVWTSTSNCYKFYAESTLHTDDWDPGGLAHADSESVRLYAKTTWDEDNTCSGGQTTPIDESTSIHTLGQGSGSGYSAAGKFTPYQSTSCGGGTAYGIEGTLYTDMYYQTANWNDEDTEFLQCDVPDTSQIDLDSPIYTDTDAHCYVEVDGDASSPNEIKVKWYVNGDFEESDTCEGSQCDDHSGSDWSHTFDLDDSSFSKGDEVYCIGRGYGEDGGHGAYEESNAVMVSNRVSTWSSIGLDKSYAKEGDNIKSTSNGEADIDSDSLSMYCCNGASCTPTTSIHDFCYSIGDSFPYDLQCTGQGISGDGTKTVRCRIYDGDDYSTIQQATYTADNTSPNITNSSVNTTIAQLNDVVRVNCTATDSGSGLGTFLIEADKPISTSQNYSMSLLFGTTYYADIQLTESGTWNFNCWVNDTVDNLANKTAGSITLSSILDVHSLSLVYQNLTQRIFKFSINNTQTSSSINNINWTLNVVQQNLTSLFNINLSASEEADIFAYHNFTSSGSYTIIATAQGESYSDQQSIQITV